MKKAPIILLNILFLVSAVGAVLVDIHYDVSIIVDFSVACSVCLTILTLIITVWFSYLLVIKQIYQKKYEQENVKKYKTVGQFIVLFDFLLLFITGITLSVNPNTFFCAHIVFFIFCTIFFVYANIGLYKKIEKNEFKNLADEKKEIILCKIKNKENHEQLAKNLQELNSIYKEFYYKKDKLACQNIILSYSDFIFAHLETKNTKILHGNDEYIRQNVKNLLNGLCNLLINENSDFVIGTNSLIINQLYNISKNFMKCGDDDFVIYAVSKHKDIVNTLSGNEAIYCNKVYGSLTNILTKALDYEKVDLVDQVIDHAQKIYYKLQLESDYSSIVCLCKFYATSLFFCLQKKTFTDKISSQYTKISKRMYDFIISEDRDEETENMYTMLDALIHDTAFSQNEIAALDFCKFVEEIIGIKSLYSNTTIIQIISNYIDVLEKLKVVSFDRLMSIKYDFCKYSLLFMKDVPGYVLPVFSDALTEASISSKDDIRYVQDMLNLTSLCIDKNNTNGLLIMLSDLKKVLVSFDISEKDRQKIWFQVYFKAFYQASLNANQRHVAILLKSFRETLSEMDAKRNVSHDLGDWIVDNLGFLCTDRYRENVDFVCQIVEYLDEVASTGKSNFYFVNNNKDLEGKIYKTVFKIGVDAIEKNQPLVIKRVSHIIGWTLLKAIRDGQNKLRQQLLPDALLLINLCIANEIDKQTIVFVGTLFVIIGAYYNVNKKPTIVKELIRELQKINCLQHIEVSKQLRAATGGWEILGDNPQEAMDGFLNKLRKKQ